MNRAKALLGILTITLGLAVQVQAQFRFTTNDGTITITGYTGPGGAVIIPDTITGLPVTSIGDYAFYESYTLSTVTIPDNVTSIGDFAFMGCSGLTGVTIGSGVNNIGIEAFAYCFRLTSVTIPNSVSSIEGWAFFDCDGLTRVAIPNSVPTIGDSAFSYCTSLTSVTIPDSVTTIGDSAFFYCTSLTALYFAGNAPTFLGSFVLFATAYYLPGTTGWGASLGGRPTALWVLPNPLILNHSSSFGVRTNQFGFIISWATNISVVVEACTNLANPIWFPITTNTLTSGSSYFSDPEWTNYPARFYRIRSP